MRDIKSHKIIWIKGSLFFLMGLGSALLLLADNPTFKSALLVAITVWAFCRSYYFAFYVIGNYVDPSFKYSGLCSFFLYLIRKKTPVKNRL
jgi:hypothetical protein